MLPRPAPNKRYPLSVSRSEASVRLPPKAVIREDGWTLDEATGHGLPPGYIRDPNFVSKPRN